MLLGLINGPFVPHNLISAKESPVPVSKFQMAPRLKILMSSGSKKGTQICYPFLSKSPVSKSHPGSPVGPLWREIPTCRAYLCLSWYISFYLSLRVPGKGAPSIFPNRVPMDRDTPSPEPLVYTFIHSFMFVCRSPQKGAFLHMGKNIRSPSTELHVDRRPTYNGVQHSSPRGLLMTLLSSHQCHAAFSTIPCTLAWVDQSPVSQHVS